MVTPASRDIPTDAGASQRRDTMQAVVYTEYGAPEVVHVQEVEKPIPRDNEALI